MSASSKLIGSLVEAHSFASQGLKGVLRCIRLLRNPEMPAALAAANDGIALTELMSQFVFFEVFTDPLDGSVTTRAQKTYEEKPARSVWFTGYGYSMHTALTDLLLTKRRFEAKREAAARKRKAKCDN